MEINACDLFYLLDEMSRSQASNTIVLDHIKKLSTYRFKHV